MSPAAIQTIKARRRTWGKLPVPASRADLYWGTRQPELVGITDGQLTSLLLLTPEFHSVIGAVLDKIDQRNRTGYGNTAGRPSRWSAWQLESVLLYRRVAGIENVKLALAVLKSDGEARGLLGFSESVPSAPTITRHLRKHFDPKERVALYRELDRQLRQRVVRLPGFDAEARILGMDGSQHGTHYTAPIPQVGGNGRTTGVIVNAAKKRGEPGAITAPTAGYVGGNHPKSGRGWQMIGLFTEHGTPVAWDISPLNEAEVDGAARALNSYEREIKDCRDPETLSVCTADGGFTSNRLRNQLQALNIVPNIHRASHKKDYLQPNEETENARKLNEKWLPFRHPSKRHYENWSANGHGEISCKCASGVVKREFPLRKSGVVPVTKGQCPSCGDVTITSGKWKLSSDIKSYVRCYRGNTADTMIGNSLTFNDPLSLEYGKDRYGFNESIHATIERRFGLLQEQSWMRDITEVETEFAITFSVVSVLLLERDARRQANVPTRLAAHRTPSPVQPANLPVAA